VSGSGDEAEVRVLPAEEAEPQPLVFHHMPIAASLGFFRAAEGGAPITVLDPGDREELVMLGSLVVVLNQHNELCALHKPGGMPVQAAHLLESLRDASDAVPHFREAVERALALEARALEARAAALARTGRMPSAPTPPPGAPPPVSVPRLEPEAPLTAATHFPATRLDGARLGLDGVALGAAAPRATDPTRAGGSAFQGGASTWDADGAGPVAAPAAAAAAAAAGAGEPLDSDEEEATGTVTSTLDRTARTAPTAAADAQKKGLKKRKGRA